MGLLQDVQGAAVDGTTDLPTLLRKCKLLAVKIGYAPLDKWVESELNGYPADAELPEYRVIPTQSYGDYTNGFQKWTNVAIPLGTFDDDIQERFRFIRLQDSVAAYADMVKHHENAVIRLAWPPSAVHYLAPKIFTNRVQCLGAWQSLPRTALVELLSTMRNRILTFALELEKIAPDAAEGTSREPAIETSQIAPVYHNVFYGGAHNVAVGSHHFEQTYHAQVSRGDLEGLRRYLEEAGVEKSDIESVARIVQEEQPTGTPPQLGERVRTWVGGIAAKAALGTGTGLAVHGIEHVVKAIAAYYGIH